MPRWAKTENVVKKIEVIRTRFLFAQFCKRRFWGSLREPKKRFLIMIFFQVGRVRDALFRMAPSEGARRQAHGSMGHQQHRTIFCALKDARSNYKPPSSFYGQRFFGSILLLTKSGRRTGPLRGKVAGSGVKGVKAVTLF